MKLKLVILGIVCWGCTMALMVPQVFSQSVFPAASEVKQTCGACHKPDERGRLEVIEDTRKTPEEWKVVIHRMIHLNHAPVPEAKFYPIVKQLSEHLCLSPKEMASVAYINSDENSQLRELPKNKEEERIFAACVRCHTYGKIASHRMTSAQWAENRTMHLGYYPTAVPQMREMDWNKESQELVAVLAKLFPYDDPDWQNWITNRKDPELTGKWNLAGYQPGLGYYTGSYTFQANPKAGPEEYVVEKVMCYENGTTLNMSGVTTLYSKYHLRGTFAPTPLTGRTEGVFDLNPEDKGFTGKWWTVVQDSNAFGNETFYKAEQSVKVVAAFPQAVMAKPEAQKLTLVGVGFPEKIGVSDIVFSDPGIKVTQVNRVDDSKLVCQIEVSGKTRNVNIQVQGAAYQNKLIVYDKIDGLRIFPAIGRARVSCGAAYPPQGVQFVARAVNFGPDGQPGTEDDILLEPVTANWWLEEEKTAEDDDDLKYLDTTIVNGLYTPVTTYAPLLSRKQHREGTGLIAVGASAKIGGSEFKDRALLAVTVPDFIPHLK